MYLEAQTHELSTEQHRASTMLPHLPAEARWGTPSDRPQPDPNTSQSAHAASRSQHCRPRADALAQGPRRVFASKWPVVSFAVSFVPVHHRSRRTQTCLSDRETPSEMQANKPVAELESERRLPQGLRRRIALSTRRQNCVWQPERQPTTQTSTVSITSRWIDSRSPKPSRTPSERLVRRGRRSRSHARERVLQEIKHSG